VTERPAKAGFVADEVWGHYHFAARRLGLITAANPVAYGHNVYGTKFWNKAWGYPLDEAHMDRVYTHYMLEQISRHEEAALATASFAQAIPWVCRFIPDPGGSDDVPLMSRGRYREILRHLWLRGADSMQIFNEPWPAGEGRARYRPEMAVEEVEDAVAVYDEMLAFREFMEKGVVMNTDIPAVTEDGAIWSGLRLEGALLIRAFTPGDKPALFSIKFSERPLELKALPKGVTYRITRKGNEPQIEQVTPEN